MNQGTILIVEDEKPIRKLVAAVLKRAGYGVLEAADAKEAVSLWAGQSAAIDLLLTDVELPGVSGPELAGEFLKTKPSLKVIFSSGHSMQSPALVSSRIPNSQLLQKPYAPAKLLEIVKAALG